MSNVALCCPEEEPEDNANSLTPKEPEPDFSRLTAEERKELEKWEAILRDNQGDDYQRGCAMLAIDKAQLYRAYSLSGIKTIKDYARQVHHITYRQLRRMVEWARVCLVAEAAARPVEGTDQPCPMGHATQAPLSKRQARPLHKLIDQPQKLLAALETAAKAPPDHYGQVATSAIEEAVADIQRQAFAEKRKSMVPDDQRFSSNFICADVRNGLPQIEPGSVDLVPCSPPYGIGLDYDGWNDLMSSAVYRQFIYDCFKVVVPLVNPRGGRIAVNLCETFGDKKTEYIRSNYVILREVMIELGMMPYQYIIWDRMSPSAAQDATWGTYPNGNTAGCQLPNARRQCEWIAIFSKGTFAKENADPKKCDISAEEFEKWTHDIWRIKPDNNAAALGHKCTFPEELVKRVLKLYGQISDVILDCFGGVGTTALVAYKLGRRFWSVDRSATYTMDARRRLLEWIDASKR